MSKSDGKVEGDEVKNSQGRRRVVPLTISTPVEEMSCLRVVQMPRRIRESESIQVSRLVNIRPYRRMVGGSSGTF